MATTNFKKETYEAISGSGHERDQVMFIGSRDGKYRMTMDEFDVIAESVNYDSGYGGQFIAGDLIVYFKDLTYFDRSEYDGSEWWNYHSPLVYSENDESKKITNFGNKERSWTTVEILNS